MSFGQIRVEEDKMEMPEDLEQARHAEELERKREQEAPDQAMSEELTDLHRIIKQSVSLYIFRKHGVLNHILVHQTSQ